MIALKERLETQKFTTLLWYNVADILQLVLTPSPIEFEPNLYIKSVTSAAASTVARFPLEASGRHGKDELSAVLSLSACYEMKHVVSDGGSPIRTVVAVATVGLNTDSPLRMVVLVTGLTKIVLLVDKKKINEVHRLVDFLAANCSDTAGVIELLAPATVALFQFDELEKIWCEGEWVCSSSGQEQSKKP